MKIANYIFLFLVLPLFAAQSQTPFFDAIELKNKFKHKIVDRKISFYAEDTVTISKVLKKYVPEAQTYNALYTAFAMNPFFELSKSNSMENKATPLDISQFTSSYYSSSIAGLDVTTYADGFAKFLVARTKEELSVAFFNRFKNLLNEEKYKDAQTLFPQTFQLLNAIGDQIYNYPVYLGALREAFEKDLNGLLITFPKIINDARYGKYFDAHPELKATILSSAFVGNELLNKTHPGRIIADYDITLLDKVDINAKGIVQTLQLFSESVRSQSTDHYWVSSDSLKIIADDPIARRIYLGLIYQKAHNIYFKGDSLQGILKIVADKSNQEEVVMIYVKNFIRQTEHVTRAVKNLEGKDLSKLTFTDYYGYYNSVITLIDTASRIYTFPKLDVLNKKEIFDAYILIARKGSDVALDITRQNYSSAVMNSYQLYSEAFKIHDADPELKEVEERVTAMKGFLFRYGSFIAAVAQAQNSDDVEKAIEVASLPVGSSSIKKHSRFDLSLNSYAGIYTGSEKIINFDKHHTTINTVGITAPIGLAFSTSFCHGWSISLFGSLVDLGAIFAFRVDAQQTEKIPTVQLKDIVSPGIFFSLGIQGAPISVNAGWQTGPNLRKVTSTINTYEHYNRWSLSCCVDMPLMTILNFPVVN